MNSEQELNCSFQDTDGGCLKSSSNDSVFTTTSIIIQAIFIFIIGCTNGSMLYIFCRCHQLRNVTNSLIINLVICNLIMLPVHTFDLILAIKPGISRGYMCLLLCGAIYLVVSVSSLTLLAVCVDKMVKVFRPCKYKETITWLRAGICLSTIWISALFVTIVIPFAGLNQVNSLSALQSTPCDIYDFVKVFYPNYPVIVAVIYGFIPCIAFGIIYGRILVFLVPQIRSSKRTLQSQLLRQEVKPMVTITVMVVTTGLAYGSITVVTWLQAFDESFTVSPALHSAITWLNYLNITVNPSVYCLRSSAFQTAWKNHLQCLPNPQRESTPFSSIYRPVVVAGRRRLSNDSIELCVEINTCNDTTSS
ncbi:trace amine-associated receptor 13c-like [Amphiura filiformis]|uniref:trace amine-associated receptor 13c-like n=1 Tax=Amphiura filiformis TaxID=82378 RepID=UPI003B20F8D2